MATTIKLKNGSGAPLASDLVQGEPALDLTNKRLYSEDSGGTVIEIGTNPSTLSIAGTAITATAAELNILDGVTATASELNILDGVTATTAELNILDGVTATFGEINLLDGSSAGAIVNSKSVIYGAAGEVNATTLQIGGVSITSTAAELNILDGVTATAAELNLLDGVTATTAELNILDGVTATAAELNVLDGVTAFVDEDDMSSDSATSIPSQQSVKAYVDSQVGSADTLAELTDTNVTTPADGALLFYDTITSKWIDNVVSGDITIADTGVAAIEAGVIVNADVNASAAIDVSKTALTAGTGLTLTTNTLSVDAAQTQITSVGTLSSLSVSGTLTLGGTDITSTAAELNILDGVTATATELNILDGVTATTAELNFVDGVTSNIQTQLDAKGTGTVSSLSDLSITATAAELNIMDGVTATTAELNILDGVTSTATELNILDGVTATTAELNILDGVTSTATELNLLDGVTATTAELNYLDITTLGLTEASKAVTADANGVVSFDNGTIEEVTSITSSSNAATINLRDGNLFEHDLTENVTYTFSNPAASGRASSFVLKVIQGSTARTITWPSSVDWPAGTAPTLTTTDDGVDVFVFFTIDGGTTYYGFTAGQAMA